jgi:hypothetical protein
MNTKELIKLAEGKSWKEFLSAYLKLKKGK